MIAPAPHQQIPTGQRASPAGGPTDSPRTALVVDDEQPIRRLMRVLMETNGYQVYEAETGKLGLEQAAARRPNLIVLDLGLPDMDGVTVLKRLREWTHVPILILTVRNDDDEKVTALDGGADDYMTKPFSAEELLARLRVLQRHSPELCEEANFVCGDLTVDITARKVTLRDTEVHLTATEYALLRELVRHAGRVVTRQHLLDAVWGPDTGSELQYLRVYIAYLRKKLKIPDSGVQIETRSGVGYRLAASS
jgi:two-component system KDP operon response regulator KdpE